ncbi:MAG TPA: bifunctional tetrahydrofolate synthase/dihydrofolate synthase [Methylophilaceae bacterium]|nr:bifunctional tetrahydrofolate synthase/dihydrofolate synthase [Methylophilaceae bacterium]
MPADLSGWLIYLEQLHPKSIALGLDRVGQVRDRLALHPEFPVITVGGTNGKGSTCAMLERIYLEAGYRVACYTSPHLLRYNERVRVDGVEASDSQLCAAFAAVEEARGETPLTYFEFGTLAAMWLFIQGDAEVAILEVGLGGRLDAVNIFDPACAIVTSVDLDHLDYLGSTRASIGREKAGIYRKGVPALCGEPQPPATVEDCAKKTGANFRQIGVDFGYVVRGGVWDFVSSGTSLQNLPMPALHGSFQLGNATCAIEAVHSLQRQLPVALEAICAGLMHVTLQGRFQVFCGRPHVILDVAHNPHAAKGLAENLRIHPHAGRTLAVFAMLGDKDIAGVVSALAGEINAWFVAPIRHSRGADADTLCACLREVVPEVQVHRFTDVEAAFHQACLSAGENDRIAAFGSFYTVADVMRDLPAMGEEIHGG